MADINFKEVLSESKDLVFPIIEKYLKQFIQFPDFCQVPEKYSYLVKLHDQIISDYPQRKGKYFRPALVLLTAQTMGFDKNLAANTAAAMQISEDWILNHDDIEDDSLERRGSPALHRIYGKELAINAGDGLHVLMWEVLRKNIDIIGVEKGLKIFDEFFKMLNRTILGQTIELFWTKENKNNLTDEDIYLILESKTGYYTVSGPMRLGASLAGASEDQLNKIYYFGTILGRTYQIIDDLLDLTSDFAGFKKQIGNDIYEGKKTLMLVHLYRNSSLEDREKLDKILCKNRYEKTEEEVKWVINLMKQYGSLEYSKTKALEFAVQAKEILENDLTFLHQEPYKSQFIAMIDFVTTRDH
jgi:geranylgeranyl diphosphate synthase, type II